MHAGCPAALHATCTHPFLNNQQCVPGVVAVAFLQMEMGSQSATQKVSFCCQPCTVPLPLGSSG